MSQNSRSHQIIGRITALCLLALAIAYGIGGSLIEYAFSSDPLGPRAMPVMLAVILCLLCLFYLRSPGEAEGFPTGPLLWRVIAIPVLLILSVLMFEPLGFAASIFFLTLSTGLLFGASLKMSLIGGVGQALLWWGIFSYLLEVYLPVGAIFG